MPTLARKFGSFLLDDTNGITVARVSEPLLVETDVQPRVKGNAATLLQQRFEGREIGLSGSIRGTRDEIRTRADALLAALSNGEQVLQLYSDRGILAFMESQLDLEWVEVMTA